MKTFTIWAKSELPNPSGRPKKKAQILLRFRSTSIDLHPTSPRPLHKPFKIKDLGLLNHMARKSVSRRCSWCNSQLLTPSGRRAMKETVLKETVFIPSPATPGENRLRSILALRGDWGSPLRGEGVPPFCVFLFPPLDPFPRLAGRKTSISQSIFSATKSSNIDPSLANKFIILIKPVPETNVDRQSINKFQF